MLFGTQSTHFYSVMCLSGMRLLLYTLKMLMRFSSKLYREAASISEEILSADKKPLSTWGRTQERVIALELAASASKVFAQMQALRVTKSFHSIDYCLLSVEYREKTLRRSIVCSTLYDSIIVQRKQLYESGRPHQRPLWIRTQEIHLTLQMSKAKTRIVMMLKSLLLLGLIRLLIWKNPFCLD